MFEPLWSNEINIYQVVQDFFHQNSITIYYPPKKKLPSSFGVRSRGLSPTVSMNVASFLPIKGNERPQKFIVERPQFWGIW